MTVGVTVHDKMSDLRPNGARGMGKNLGKSAAKKALMARNWGEQSNSNLEDTIKLIGLASEQHLVI